MPSVLFYVVESTLDLCAVTAEAAGSNPVVFAIIPGKEKRYCTVRLIVLVCTKLPSVPDILRL
jgi:hypothetical protein